MNLQFSAKSFHFSALSAAIAALSLAACGGPDVCSTQDGVTVCGSFGSAGYIADVQARAVSWPPVAVADGRLVLAGKNELVEIAPDGRVSSLAATPGAVAIPSADAQGVYVLSGSQTGATLQAYDAATRSVRWTSSLQGTPVGAPPAISNGANSDGGKYNAAKSAHSIYVATNDGGSGATIWRVDAATGQAVLLHDSASPAVIAADNTIRYLRSPTGVDSLAHTPLFTTLVAEDADGKELWHYDEPAGIVDLAPGPGGEAYIVTGTASGQDSHVLRRIESTGSPSWTFRPDCGDCTVAAAPTIDGDRVYFPVWEVRQTKAIDPLYALDAKTGMAVWTYDGFDNVTVSVSGAKMLIPGSGDMVDKTSTRHHPAGRPVVAQDGTLYVASDGAVVALNHNGQLLGYAQYDAKAGEVTANGFLTQGNWVNPGVRPSPVLGPDGTLYVSDGASIRAFHTARPASHTAWVAPYGGPSNDSRAQ